MNYRVVPISSEIAASARKNMKSPQYGHPAFADIAAGYGPCRVCLKAFVEGTEERILFTYNAFENLAKLPLPSPIFIHRLECKPFSDDGFPPELMNLPLLFESYGEESELIKREPIREENIENQIMEMSALPKVKYINIRNAEAGCFVAHIELSR